MISIFRKVIQYLACDDSKSANNSDPRPKQISVSTAGVHVTWVQSWTDLPAAPKRPAATMQSESAADSGGDVVPEGHGAGVAAPLGQ